MSNELSTLRSKAVKLEADPSLLQKCTVLEKDRDELCASLKAAEEQLDALRREIIVLTLQASSVNLGRYMLKSDHAAAFKTSEEELLTNMKNQLVKGFAEMKKQAAEAVEAAVASQRSEIKRLEGDCNHFSASLADAMNEVTTLRNKYQDWEEWEEEEGEQEHDDEGDKTGKWYKDDAGYREAAGVGLEYSERVRRAAAPLS